MVVRCEWSGVRSGVEWSGVCVRGEKALDQHPLDGVKPEHSSTHTHTDTDTHIHTHRERGREQNAKKPIRIRSDF